VSDSVHFVERIGEIGNARRRHSNTLPPG
jgi:hypothetical protein